MPKKQSRYRPTSLLVGVSLCMASLLSAPVPAAAAACQPGEAGCVLPVGTAPPPVVTTTTTPTSTPVYTDVDDGGGMGWLLPLLLGAAALAALYFLVIDDDGDDDDVPISP